MKIRVFSTPFCPYCVALKSYLDDNKIVYEYLDVSDNIPAQKEMIEKTNQMGVPVMNIGDEWIIGFDKAKIAQILDIKEK
ncbi:glutaredoxin family protein [Candidatus Parcubacteria bacterium]|nr:glutaredoxin family protein [Candidatus Parcubacteria bacterium]